MPAEIPLLEPAPPRPYGDGLALQNTKGDVRYEFPSLGPRSTETPDPTIFDPEEAPSSVGQESRNEVGSALARLEELEADPLNWEWKNKEILSEEISRLATGTLDALKSGGLSIHEAKHIFDKSIAVLKKFGLPFSEGDYVRHPEGIDGFQKAAEHTTQLFGKLQSREAELGPKEDIDASKTLLLFAGPHRGTVHQHLFSKYKDELLSSDTANNSSLQELWESPTFLYLTGLEAAKDWSEDSFLRMPNEALFKVLKSFGFESKEAWDIFFGSKVYEDTRKRSQNLKDSMYVMASLASVSLDLPSKIYSRFGIRHFGRYQADTLWRQFQEFDADTSLGVGGKTCALLVTSTGDWNGAMAKQERRFGRMSPRPIFMEAASLRELSKRVLSTRKHVGPISSLIINGHGNESLIELGDGTTVTQEVLASSGALARIREKDIFTPQAEIILISCETGKEGGIAETISNRSGMAVIAPTVATSGFVERDYTKEKGHNKIIFPDKSYHDKSGLSRLAIIRRRRAGVKIVNGKRKRVKTTNLMD